MERSAAPLIVSILVLAGFAVAMIVLAKLRERARAGSGKQSPEELARREASRKAAEALKAGTHVQLDDGAIVPKCRHCSDPATRRPLKWLRDTGIVDLIRRRFGAPDRHRAGESVWAAPFYCESHEALAREEYRIELARYESERAVAERDWAVRLARFEQVGVHARLDEQIAKHEREVGNRKRRTTEVPGKVVPFTSSGRTGTG
jgi:hypothetical protein